MVDEDSFKGLPIRDLISSPLVACCQAQMMINKETIDFIESLINDDKTPKSLNFSIQKSFIDEYGITKNTLSNIKAPILGLVNVPSLMVQKLEIDFSMEITSTASIKKQDNQVFDLRINDDLPQKFEMRGKLSCSEKSIRSTDQSSKYFVKVTATQSDPPEGLARILDAMASSIGA